MGLRARSEGPVKPVMDAMACRVGTKHHCIKNIIVIKNNFGEKT